MASAAVYQDIVAGRPNKLLTQQHYDDNILSIYENVVKKLGTEESVPFVPEKHLKYYANDLEKHKFNTTRRLTMEELGLSNKLQISPIGVSDPFPLFTDEAVDIMRKEILQKDLFRKYARFAYSSTTGLDSNIRGYVKNNDKIECPFIYEAWSHPKTMELVSMMAGVDLEIIMDYEIGNINIGMKSEQQAEQERIKVSREKALGGSDDGEDIPAIVGWHHDSYPFVCVLMLSDTTNMIGGETSLRMGVENAETPQVAVVPGPQLGNACVLQGRLIEHIAPTPLGSAERITMVTSYRAKDPLVHDGSVLKTVKPEVNFGSRFNDFYPQWIEYRAKTLKARLDHMVAKVDKSWKDGETFDKEGTMQKLQEIEDYLKKTRTEMEITDYDMQKMMASQ